MTCLLSRSNLLKLKASSGMKISLPVPVSRNFQLTGHINFLKVLASGHNATDKTPMYEMPLIYVFGVGGLGFWVWGEHFWY